MDLPTIQQHPFRDRCRQLRTRKYNLHLYIHSLTHHSTQMCASTPDQNHAIMQKPTNESNGFTIIQFLTPICPADVNCKSKPEDYEDPYEIAYTKREQISIPTDVISHTEILKHYSNNSPIIPIHFHPITGKPQAWTKRENLVSIKIVETSQQ